MDLPDITEKEKKIVLASELLKDGVGSVGLAHYYEKSEKRGWRIDQGKFRGMEKLLEDEGVKIVGFWERLYPKGLFQLSDRPVILFCRGDVNLLGLEMVTIVGTRRSTIYGSRVVKMAVGLLVGKGVCVVSGLAYGIDRKVHQTALRDGKTVAVVAGGIDQGFPDRNRDIYEDISENGLVISEFPPGRGVIKGMFPMRNRIMAALSSHTIVIEAPVKSGALITSNIAIELGREVYSVPGDIFRENSRGTNLLIEDGAFMINSMRDVEEISLKCEEFFTKLKMD